MRNFYLFFSSSLLVFFLGASALSGQGPQNAPAGMDCTTLDSDGDGRISSEEWGKNHIDKIDSNKDGQISRDEMKAFHDAKRKDRGRSDRPARLFEQHFKEMDANKDGQLSREEMQARFQKLDGNKDGFVSCKELRENRFRDRADYNEHDDEEEDENDGDNNHHD